MDIVFHPKDEKLMNIFDRLMRDNAAVIDTRLAMDLSRHKVIRELRRNTSFFIGMDRSKRKSIVFCPVKIVKKNDKFFFRF